MTQGPGRETGTSKTTHLLAGAEVYMEVEAAAPVDDGHVEAAEAGEAYSVAGGDPFKHVDALKH